jgi:hypothetical protein
MNTKNLRKNIFTGCHVYEILEDQSITSIPGEFVQAAVYDTEMSRTQILYLPLMTKQYEHILYVRWMKDFRKVKSSWFGEKVFPDVSDIKEFEPADFGIVENLNCNSKAEIVELTSKDIQVKPQETNISQLFTESQLVELKKLVNIKHLMDGNMKRTAINFILENY